VGKQIILKSPSEIKKMFAANQIVANTLELVEAHVKPGVSTWKLDQLAEKNCRKQGAVPAFKGYRGFPGSLCVSVNEEVVHGIPSRKRILKEGDVISVDFGVKKDGFYGDSAMTIPVGSIATEIANLLEHTQQSLYCAIGAMQLGNRVHDVSKAVEQYVDRYGYGIVRQFVGHGIGTDLHELPEVPNFYSGRQTPKLHAGMVLAIEPMINLGTGDVKVLKDGWTVITADKKFSAHFEHSVAVTADGPFVLSQRSNEII
jgi:methionyl aminopeptidase